jgi:hypothetical protein
MFQPTPSFNRGGKLIDEGGRGRQLTRSLGESGRAWASKGPGISVSSLPAVHAGPWKASAREVDGQGEAGDKTECLLGPQGQVQGEDSQDSWGNDTEHCQIPLLWRYRISAHSEIFLKKQKILSFQCKIFHFQIQT